MPLAYECVYIYSNDQEVHAHPSQFNGCSKKQNKLKRRRKSAHRFKSWRRPQRPKRCNLNYLYLNLYCLTWIIALKIWIWNAWNGINFLWNCIWSSMKIQLYYFHIQFSQFKFTSWNSISIYWDTSGSLRKSNRALIHGPLARLLLSR